VSVSDCVPTCAQVNVVFAATRSAIDPSLALHDSESDSPFSFEAEPAISTIDPKRALTGATIVSVIPGHSITDPVT
jgi:hypothetical protein